MPYTYNSPGVYIEEIDRGPRPIRSASTAVLAMIGLCRETIQITEVGKKTPTFKAPPGEPTLVTNWTEFSELYGDFNQAVPGSYLHQSMFGYFMNGGTSAYVVGLPMPVAEKEEAAPPALVPGEAVLVNSASQPVMKVSAGALKEDETIEIEVQRTGDGPESPFNLTVRRKDTPPQLFSNISLTGKGGRSSLNNLPRDTGGLKFELLDGADAPTDRIPAPGVTSLKRMELAPVAQEAAANLKQKLTYDLGEAISALEAVEEITLLAFPDLVAARQWNVFDDKEMREALELIVAHCEKMKDRFAILDCPPGMSVQAMKAWRAELNSSKFAALYYPWIEVKSDYFMPPSGYVAGVYSRVDAERGVHKAPANEAMRGVIGLERKLSRSHQDELNPNGINCIRSFPNQGIRIWGARTLAGPSEGQWTYINVRRLFSSIEKSILQGTSWVVFEPNSQLLWLNIRRDITSYLTTLWETGALFGSTPEQAFYVKCDEELNPPRVRDLGYCVIEVGIAPVKPAEFVVFRISQKDDGSGAATE